MTRLRDALNDTLLSLLCGIALLVVVRAAYQLSVGWLPDPWLMAGDDPLARLALARLVLFGAIVVAFAMPLAWPLARHAARRDLNAALPGAACAAVLFVLLETVLDTHPFPRWMDHARALLLFAALPVATCAWWRLAARSGD